VQAPPSVGCRADSAVPTSHRRGTTCSSHALRLLIAHLELSALALSVPTSPHMRSETKAWTSLHLYILELIPA